MKALTMASMVFLAALLLWLTNGFGADATVTFTDNSADEDGFKVERNLNGGAYTPLATLAKNINQLIDTTLVQSSTTDNKYCYRVYAFNAAGNSAYANTATPGVTDCKTVPKLVTIPNGPTGVLVQ